MNIAECADVLKHGDFEACVRCFQNGPARRPESLAGASADELAEFWSLSQRFFSTCVLAKSKTREEMDELERPIAERARQLWGKHPKFDWIWVGLRQLAYDMHSCCLRRVYTDEESRFIAEHAVDGRPTDFCSAVCTALRGTVK